MAFNEELDMLLKDLTEEANNFKEAENPGKRRKRSKICSIFSCGEPKAFENTSIGIMNAVGTDNSSVNQAKGFKRLPKFLVYAKWKFLLVRMINFF